MFNEVPGQFDFPKMEQEILAFWEKNNIYEQSLKQREGCKPFVFYEGPPTANGLPHPGHCLTRAIKDLFPRYKTMTGHYCLRKGGWDTHGLPVEVEVCKELGIHSKEEIEAYGVEPFNRRCLESVFRYTRQWEEMTKRLGFWVNLDEAYVTYHQSYVESVWWSLKQLFDAGLLYQGHKIVWWWAQGGTALSAGEVGQGYRAVDDPSVYVRFPLVQDKRFAEFMAKAASTGGTGVPPVQKAGMGSMGGMGGVGGADVPPVQKAGMGSMGGMGGVGGTGVPPVPPKGTGPDLSIRRRYLPHWEAGGSTYFITFRTRRGELTAAERNIVYSACLHFDGTRADIHALVVMPDHVHLLLTPLPREGDTWWSLAELMHSIKSYSAKEIRKHRGGSGSVWMEEYFDRIIRCEEDFNEKLNYITDNPLKRGFDEGYDWVWVESIGPDGSVADGRDARTTQEGLQTQPGGSGADGRDAATTQCDVPERGGASDSSVAHRRAQDPSPRISLLVWTTTPWTLPSNMYAAVHADFDYALVLDEVDGERLIFAEALVEPIAKKLKATKRWKVERTFKGRELIGLRYRPPFDCYAQRQTRDFVPNADATPLADFRPKLAGGGVEHALWRVLAADFVTLDAGTGLVHQAPAFGEVDFELFQNDRKRFEYPDAIPLLNAVAPNGTFTSDFPAYEGRWVKGCDKDICQDMKQRGILVFQEQYRHDYPFCWRAEEDPLIQYPRRSWFIRTTQFKEAMLANNRRIHWLPEHIKTGRFGKFLESNVDWSLSRERYWGTPLPIWVCSRASCGHTEANDSYEALLAKPGVAGLDVWERARREHPDLSEHLKVHKPYIDAITYDCPKCAENQRREDQSRDRKGAVGANERGPLPDGRSSDSGGTIGRMRRVPEVIDCWYDSGAMPFAQWGFPHRNREIFARQFPADFISEALDQTRGWFYSLTAISVMLFGEKGVARDALPSDNHAHSRTPNDPQSAIRDPQSAYPQPFRTCIVLGLLMGEDGLKMSKQKQNYKEPGYIFEHEGADAMRWLFFSGQTPWTSIRFQESAIAEGQREFLIRLYNCYSFFVIYANIDKWTPEPGRHGQALHARADAEVALSRLDRWILSELDACCVSVFRSMEAYDNFNAARALNLFVDALSNWYVRRNRDRFWRSEIDADKQAAYATLCHCLVTLSKLIAPFTPFLAESMYRNLVRTHDPEAPESVHLCDYPINETNRAEIEGRIDTDLNREIEAVRQLVSCGRAARAAAKLRVRQPLAAIELFHRRAEEIRPYEDIIRDELNVARVDYVPGAQIDKYVSYEIKPDFKVIGPRYGPLAPKIKAALAAHADVDSLVRMLETNGRCTLEVEGRSVELGADEVHVELHAKEGYAAERIPGYGVIVLDTHITPELRDEGWARDLVNQIQQIRKRLDLRYEQRIDLAIEGDEDIRRVVNTHADYIRGETLAQALLNQPLPHVDPVEVEFDSHTATIYVKPLDATVLDPATQ